MGNAMQVTAEFFDSLPVPRWNAAPDEEGTLILQLPAAAPQFFNSLRIWPVNKAQLPPSDVDPTEYEELNQPTSDTVPVRVWAVKRPMERVPTFYHARLVDLRRPVSGTRMPEKKADGASEARAVAVRFNKWVNGKSLPLPSDEPSAPARGATQSTEEGLDGPVASLVARPKVVQPVAKRKVDDSDSTLSPNDKRPRADERSSSDILSSSTAISSPTSVTIAAKSPGLASSFAPKLAGSQSAAASPTKPSTAASSSTSSSSASSTMPTPVSSAKQATADGAKSAGPLPSKIAPKASSKKTATTSRDISADPPQTASIKASSKPSETSLPLPAPSTMPSSSGAKISTVAAAPQKKATPEASGKLVTNSKPVADSTLAKPASSKAAAPLIAKLISPATTASDQTGPLTPAPAESAEARTMAGTDGHEFLRSMKRQFDAIMQEGERALAATAEKADRKHKSEITKLKNRIQDLETQNKGFETAKSALEERVTALERERDELKAEKLSDEKSRAELEASSKVIEAGLALQVAQLTQRLRDEAERHQRELNAAKEEVVEQMRAALNNI